MIRFSRSEDYALILVNSLAKETGKVVPLSKIAHKYKISILFLRNLANILRHGGIIGAVEGKNGGYYLNKDPKKLKIGEILELFPRDTMLECCSRGDATGFCDKVDFCDTGSIWRKLNQEFLDKVSRLSIYEFTHYRNSTLSS